MFETRDGEKGEGEVVYKLDVPANRYDLLCLEGLSVALLVFLNKSVLFSQVFTNQNNWLVQKIKRICLTKYLVYVRMSYPQYRAIAPSDRTKSQKLIIKPNVSTNTLYNLPFFITYPSFSKLRGYITIIKIKDSLA
jgi:hypothetical protein